MFRTIYAKCARTLQMPPTPHGTTHFICVAHFAHTENIDHIDAISAMPSSSSTSSTSASQHDGVNALLQSRFQLAQIGSHACAVTLAYACASPPPPPPTPRRGIYVLCRMIYSARLLESKDSLMMYLVKAHKMQPDHTADFQHIDNNRKLFRERKNKTHRCRSKVQRKRSPI